MLLLGVRMTFAGGRESLARLALMGMGVAIRVPLILLAFSALPVMQSHVDRLAWHRTTAESPPTAPDPALWLAVTDRYEGRDIIRVHVAALGERPPVPPGVDRLPGPGEKVVSPALAELMRADFPAAPSARSAPTACSCPTTVSVITGVLERRRPFAVLRASGVRLGELRRMVLLETGAPLAFTVLLAAGLATLQSLATIPPDRWILPSAGFFAGLGGGVVAAFAVSLIVLPFMDSATRLDSVRYE